MGRRCSSHRHVSNREVIVDTKIMKDRTTRSRPSSSFSVHNSLRSAATSSARIGKTKCLKLSIENENRRENGRATIHVIGLTVSRVSSSFL